MKLIQSLEALKKKEEEAVHRVRVVRQQIEQFEIDKVLPNLKKKYEGKYFKFHNSSSTEEKWWVYIYCKKVIDTRLANVNSFETSPYQNEFKVNDQGGLFLCQKEITKGEYMLALKAFKQKISSLSK